MVIARLGPHGTAGDSVGLILGRPWENPVQPAVRRRDLTGLVDLSGRSAGPVSRDAGIRRSRPLGAWATLGAAFVAVQAYVYLRWFASGRAGPRSAAAVVPESTKIAAWIVQVSVVVIVVATVAFLVRDCLRTRRLTLDAMLAIAWLSVEWQDPVINYVRPSFFYSSYLWHVSSWAPYIPGWVSPNAGNLPQPFTISGIGYLQAVPAVVAATGILHRVAARWPRTPNAVLFLLALVIGFGMDIGYELMAVRTHLYAYSGVHRAWSIWGGRTYQFPVYEAVVIGGIYAAVTMLRYHRDSAGRTFIERDGELLERPRPLARTLAYIAFMNLCFVVYNVVLVTSTLSMDATPTYPDHLRNGICGAGTAYPCPGPNDPIPLRTQRGITPARPATR
jgi:Spirocyclase AveC-like